MELNHGEWIGSNQWFLQVAFAQADILHDLQHGLTENGVTRYGTLSVDELERIGENIRQAAQPLLDAAAKILEPLPEFASDDPAPTAAAG